ncbi:hypothetical protein C8R45DRAFT_559583 [Mycena sanguinolenta]|nr:hypothetical protein C8R45DRAFT_559583 [Mycena sanguinolenta]
MMFVSFSSLLALTMALLAVASPLVSSIRAVSRLCTNIAHRPRSPPRSTEAGIARPPLTSGKFNFPLQSNTL